MKKETRHAGNGRVCLTHPDHGPSIVLPNGAEWCPAQIHDGGRMREGQMTPAATTPWLAKQEVVEEASA